MIRQGSLVSADVAWPEAKGPTQCLVTWEVAGGGLMGNLLTDSAGVELSLWPETKYRVQVTCKNKVSPQEEKQSNNCRLVTICGRLLINLLPPTNTLALSFWVGGVAEEDKPRTVVSEVSPTPCVWCGNN